MGGSGQLWPPTTAWALWARQGTPESLPPSTLMPTSDWGREYARRLLRDPLADAERIAELEAEVGQLRSEVSLLRMGFRTLDTSQWRWQRNLSGLYVPREEEYWGRMSMRSIKTAFVNWQREQTRQSIFQEEIDRMRAEDLERQRAAEFLDSQPEIFKRSYHESPSWVDVLEGP